MSIQDEVKILAHRSLQADKDPARPTLPPGTTDAEIDAFEDRTGLVVPPELREWLHFSNGPCIGEGGIFGVRTPERFDDIESHLHSWPEWHEKGWIPIAGDGCGSYYLLMTREEDGPGHPVFFLDHEDQLGDYWTTPAYVCGSDLWHFLRFYLRADLEFDEEAPPGTDWPFNRDKVLAEDPALADYMKVPRAWEVD